MQKSLLFSQPSTHSPSGEEMETKHNTTGNGELKIEKGIPIPVKRGGVFIPFDAMEIGDSILIKGIGQSNVVSRLYAFRPKKFTTRSLESGVRVWRIA
jgi:hypothetical protein